MRISDWSSDVCSSDLQQRADLVGLHQVCRFAGQLLGTDGLGIVSHQRIDNGGAQIDRGVVQCAPQVAIGEHPEQTIGVIDHRAQAKPLLAHFDQGMTQGSARRDARYVVAAMRSEEHTSELQSLMRISYAVFCLKKKTK